MPYPPPCISVCLPHLISQEPNERTDEGWRREVLSVATRGDEQPAQDSHATTLLALLARKTADWRRQQREPLDWGVYFVAFCFPQALIFFPFVCLLATYLVSCPALPALLGLFCVHLLKRTVKCAQKASKPSSSCPLHSIRWISPSQFVGVVTQEGGTSGHCRIPLQEAQTG